MTANTKLSRDIQKQAAEKAEKHAKNLRTWARDSMESYAAYLKGETEKFAKAEETAKALADQWAEVLYKLRAAGFKPSTSNWDFDITLRVKKKQLNKLYHAIGKLNGKKLYKDIHDAQKHEVTVSMPSVAYPFVTVSFVHKLKKDDKCKIETVEVPARTEHRLVCERS